MSVAKNVFLPIGAGLIVAQLIATCFVFLSNIEVHQLVLAVEQTGYFAVPHGKAAAALTGWSTAFWGGLFYTLSVGTGLTLITWALWHFWILVLKQNRRLILVLYMLWSCLLVWLLWPFLLDAINTLWPSLPAAIKTKGALLSTLFYLFVALVCTLSVGGILTLATWTIWKTCATLSPKNCPMVVVLCIFSASLLAVINIKGPTLFPSLFCLLVPFGTVGVLTKFGSPPTDTGRHGWIIPVTTLGLLIALWASQMNQNLFIAIRDHLLLSNATGRAVNDFYYKYTLFAAQAFKSVYQKTLRTYHLDGPTDGDLAKRIKSRLIRFDVLHVPELSTPDITIAISKANIALSSKHGDRVTGELAAFLKNPNNLLQSLSKASDRYPPLRRLTLYGLLFGFPILLFVGVYGGIRIGMGMLTGRRLGFTQSRAGLATALLCLVIGIGLYWPMRASSSRPLSDDSVPAALTAKAWPERVAALRHIEKQNIDLAQYPQYRTLLRSELPVERYWLARSLAVSRSPATYSDLLSLLNDDHPNVRCQVYYALGRRGKRMAIDKIKTQMIASDHWYTQWYGYRALRRLGWHQGLSNS